MELSSAPHTVTVHRQGATVTRRIPLEAPTTGSVQLIGLPLALVESSVTLMAEGGDVELRAVRVSLHARPRQESPLTPDHAALKEVRHQLEQVRRFLEQLRLEVQLFEGVPMPDRPIPPEGSAPPPSPLAARVALDGFVDAMLQARLTELRDAERRHAELVREEAALLDTLHRAAGARLARPEELTRSVGAELVVRAPGPTTLVLSYRVPGARWVPQYSLDVARDGSAATLKLRAAVAQASGEDWTGVQLVLSTATPLSFCPLPVLDALRIGKVQPPPPAASPRPAPQGADRLYADYDRARRGLVPPPAAAPQAAPRPPMELALEPAIAMAADDESFADLELSAQALAADEAPMMMREEAAPRRRMAAAPAPPPPAPMMSAPAGGAAPASAKKRSAKPQAPAPEPATPGYDQLRLRAPDHPRRGTLEVVAELERLTELLSAAQLTVDFDLQGLLARARRQAQQVADLALPPGASPVAPDRFDHAVQAHTRVDLPGDGAWHTVPVQQASGGCTLRYVGVPRVEPWLYRVAQVENPLRTPLLAGPVEVYVDGAYVLTTELPVAGPGETFELGLGVEPALRIARNTRFEEARSGDRVAMTELHHHIVVQLHNTLGRDADVEIRERLPQPHRDAEVAVDEVEVSPAWEAWDQKTLGRPLLGGRRWRLVVPARDEVELHAHYVVRLYANHEVVGGNRRENG